MAFEHTVPEKDNWLDCSHSKIGFQRLATQEKKTGKANYVVNLV